MESENGTIVEGRSRANWGRRALIGGMALAGISAVGVAGALSQGMGMMMGGGFGMGFGEHRIERMLEDVKATPDQEKKIWAIVDGAHSDIRPIIQDVRGTRQDLLGLLTGATVDPAAVEKLRAERIATIDAASKKMTAALVEAAQVLTPEQRASLAAELKDDGPRRGGHWGGRW